MTYSLTDDLWTQNATIDQMKSANVPLVHIQTFLDLPTALALRLVFQVIVDTNPSLVHYFMHVDITPQGSGRYGYPAPWSALWTRECDGGQSTGLFLGNVKELTMRIHGEPPRSWSRTTNAYRYTPMEAFAGVKA